MEIKKIDFEKCPFNSVLSKVSEVCLFYGYSYKVLDHYFAFAIVDSDVVTSALITELSSIDRVHFMSVSVVSGSLRVYFQIY